MYTHWQDMVEPRRAKLMYNNISETSGITLYFLRGTKHTDKIPSTLRVCSKFVEGGMNSLLREQSMVFIEIQYLHCNILHLPICSQHTDESLNKTNKAIIPQRIKRWITVHRLTMFMSTESSSNQVLMSFSLCTEAM